MNKFEAIKKQLNISKDTQINVPIYDENTFVELKLGDKDDFLDLPCIEDIAYEYFVNLESTTLNTIKFKVIDKNYLNYLKKKNLTNSIVNLNNYIKNIDEKDNEKLWKKYEYNYGYDWAVLPLIFENKGFLEHSCEYNFTVSDKSFIDIRKILYNSFKNYNEDNITFGIDENDIYVSPYILRIPDFNNDDIIDELFDDGCKYLHDNVRNIDKSKSIQKIDIKTPLDFYGIFIMYRYKVPNTIDKAYIEKAKVTTMNRPDLDVYSIEKILANDIDIIFESLTMNLLYPESFPAAISGFAEVITEQINTKMQTMESMNNLIAGHCKKNKKNN